MKNLTKYLIADTLAFFDSLTAHTVVPIIPAWVVYLYALPIELAVIFGLEKAVKEIRRVL
jgi:hypothetical protein